MEHRRSKNVVGANIRKLRYAQGLSQSVLAARLNVAGCDISRGTLAKIEAQIRRISEQELFVIAKVLKVEMKDLFSKNFTKKIR